MNKNSYLALSFADSSESCLHVLFLLFFLNYVASRCRCSYKSDPFSPLFTLRSSPFVARRCRGVFRVCEERPRCEECKKAAIEVFYIFLFYFCYFSFSTLFSPSSSSFLFSLSCAFFFSLFFTEFRQIFFCAVAADWLDVTNDQILFFLPLFFSLFFGGSYISPLYVLSTLNFFFFFEKMFPNTQ